MTIYPVEIAFAKSCPRIVVSVAGSSKPILKELPKKNEEIVLTESGRTELEAGN